MDSGGRVRLQIVAATEVRPHEVADAGREARIERRLQEDQMLRDPLMVGAVHDLDGYVLLDGTNRKRALSSLGFPWLMVQVIDYGDERAAQLRTWSHLARLGLEELLDSAQAIPNLAIIPLPPLAVSDALREPGTLAVVLDSQYQYALVRQPSSPARAEHLCRLVNLYEPVMTRVEFSAHDIEENAQALTDAEPRTLIAFPTFSRSQVVTMAIRGSLIPAGITRHVILSGRALRVNLPLSMLSSARTLDEANAELERHLETLQPRAYHEPTVLYDS